jgi:hypothetical protein
MDFGAKLTADAKLLINRLHLQTLLKNCNQ